MEKIRPRALRPKELEKLDFTKIRLSSLNGKNGAVSASTASNRAITLPDSFNTSYMSPFHKKGGKSVIASATLTKGSESKEFEH